MNDMFNLTTFYVKKNKLFYMHLHFRKNKATKGQRSAIAFYFRLARKLIMSVYFWLILLYEYMI